MRIRYLAIRRPLYVDACLKELYPTLKFGATTYIIPKNLFMFPMKLVGFLNEHKINTNLLGSICFNYDFCFWCSAEESPKYLHTVAFGSEVFPIKQFNLWKRHFCPGKVCKSLRPYFGNHRHVPLLRSG